MALDAKAVDAKRSDLDKAVREGAPVSSILKILSELKTGVVPSEKLLRETKIGVSVNRLRNHKDPNVQKFANDTVVSWRTAMHKLKVGASSASGSATPKQGRQHGSTSPGDTNASPAPAAAGVKQEKKAYQGDPAKRNATVDEVEWKVTKNATRDGCVKLMYDGLAHTSTECSLSLPSPLNPISTNGRPTIAPNIILAKALEIESAALAKHGPDPTSDAYRQKMRSLFQNLKNKSNPGLRLLILSGTIPSAKFVTMTHDELKSDSRKEEEAKMQKENMDKAMTAQEIKSVSDALRCGKCGQKRVSYTQAQTRSADEPMTTFCECLNCGNRWKFS
jgi:transcription elongation factor S-II